MREFNKSDANENYFKKTKKQRINLKFLHKCFPIFLVNLEEEQSNTTNKTVKKDSKQKQADNLILSLSGQSLTVSLFKNNKKKERMKPSTYCG